MSAKTAAKTRKPAKSPAKPSKRGTSEPGPAQEAKKTEAKAPKTAKPTEPKGPGVIASIVEFLSVATETKPITRQHLIEKLVARFPDREPTALTRTLGCQLARLPKERDLAIKRTADRALYVAKSK